MFSKCSDMFLLIFSNYAFIPDSAYKQALEVLERARKSWEADMEEACEVGQIKRNAVLRN